jgi:hypothetical protein
LLADVVKDRLNPAGLFEEIVATRPAKPARDGEKFEIGGRS